MNNVICYVCGAVYPTEKEVPIDSWLKSGRLKGTAWLKVEPINTYACSQCRNDNSDEILQDIIFNTKKKRANKK